MPRAGNSRDAPGTPLYGNADEANAKKRGVAEEAIRYELPTATRRGPGIPRLAPSNENLFQKLRVLTTRGGRWRGACPPNPPRSWGLGLGHSKTCLKGIPKWFCWPSGSLEAWGTKANTPRFALNFWHWHPRPPKNHFAKKPLRLGT